MDNEYILKIKKSIENGQTGEIFEGPIQFIKIDDEVFVIDHTNYTINSNKSFYLNYISGLNNTPLLHKLTLKVMWGKSKFSKPKIEEVRETLNKARNDYQKSGECSLEALRETLNKARNDYQKSGECLVEALNEIKNKMKKL